MQKTRLLDGQAQNRAISDGTARPHPKTRLLDGREAEVFFPEQGVVCKQGAQPRASLPQQAAAVSAIRR